MLKKNAIAAALITSVSLMPFSFASASERYKVKAPVMVDSNLAAPWLNQLGGGRIKAYVPSAKRTTSRKVVYTKPKQTLKKVKKKAAPPQLDPRFLPQMVAYDTPQRPGSIIIDTNNRFLYLVMANGKARRYGVGVAKPGFEWAGTHKVTRKQVWPTWTPPQEMIAREAAKGHYLPNFMEGGPKNPLGARALYLGSTLYRIHGTNAPWTIGRTVSSGCIRMRNEDVVDLYERVSVGAKVTVI